MTTTEKETLYLIGEVARLTGVAVKTIRFYADSDLLLPARTTAARYRLFSTADIWRLQMIRVLRQFGFGLESIRAIMAGDLDLGRTLDWQLAALDQQIGQLNRVKAILQQVRDQSQTRPEKPDQTISLQLLQQLGLALNDNSQERHRFLAGKLRAMVVEAVPAAPSEWQAVLLASFDQLQFPAEFNAEQARAWGELIQMLNDPNFTAEAQHGNTHFMKMTPSPEISLEWYNSQMLGMVNRAQQLANKGVSPESAATLELAVDWAEFAARIQGQTITPEFLSELTEVTSRLFQKRVQRFWDLIALLSGRPPHPSYEKAFEMLGAILRTNFERILAIRV